jgi:hypothetical protein
MLVASVPSYFKHKKDQCLNKCQEMGMDVFEVTEFIEEKGIPEDSFELIIDYLKSPDYKNPLKRSKAKGQAPRQEAPIQAPTRNECKVCLDREVSTVLIPCGHSCLCL